MPLLSLQSGCPDKLASDVRVCERRTDIRLSRLLMRMFLLRRSLGPAAAITLLRRNGVPESRIVELSNVSRERRLSRRRSTR